MNPNVERLGAVVRRVAGSHDHCCSPELRGIARYALGLGECEERQDCPFRGGCGVCTGGEQHLQARYGGDAPDIDAPTAAEPIGSIEAAAVPADTELRDGASDEQDAKAAS